MEEEKSRSELKILAIQLSSVVADKEANFSKLQKLVEKSLTAETDILILPEVWPVGWKCSEFKNSAESLEDSETISLLSTLAKKYNTNIIGGSFISKQKTLNGERMYNTCPVINRQGQLIATYDKMHLFSYYGCDEGNFVENGNNPVLVDYCLNSREIASVDINSQASQLSPRNDVIKIGLTICYDIRFPEIYRAYRKAGVDMLVNMAAWPMNRAIHWEALTKARAIENQCFMIALTQSGIIDEKESNDWNLGHSRIIDYNGNVIAETNEIDGYMSASIKFNDMYEFRKKCTVLCDIHDNYDIK